MKFSASTLILASALVTLQAGSVRRGLQDASSAPTLAVTTYLPTDTSAFNATDDGMPVKEGILDTFDGETETKGLTTTPAPDATATAAGMVQEESIIAEAGLVEPTAEDVNEEETSPEAKGAVGVLDKFDIEESEEDVPGGPEEFVEEEQSNTTPAPGPMKGQEPIPNKTPAPVSPKKFVENKQPNTTPAPVPSKGKGQEPNAKLDAMETKKNDENKGPGADLLFAAEGNVTDVAKDGLREGPPPPADLQEAVDDKCANYDCLAFSNSTCPTAPELADRNATMIDGPVEIAPMDETEGEKPVPKAEEPLGPEHGCKLPPGPEPEELLACTCCEGMAVDEFNFTGIDVSGLAFLVGYKVSAVTSYDNAASLSSLVFSSVTVVVATTVMATFV